jgi:hypothetical protein
MRAPAISMWFAALGGLAVAPVASAVPFTVEITIPHVTGYTFPSGIGTVGTRFTASRIVLRVTGDTTNVVYRRLEGGSLYQASSVSIEIPGIGDGRALGADVAVSVGSESVRVVSPAYPTAFDMGVRASFGMVAGYDMQADLGPVALSDAFTYHWGPTSGMIPFTLDNGVTGTVSGGDKEGGVLKVTVGGTAPNPVAARPYTDLVNFQKATGPNRVATFEEGTGDASAGVTFGEGELQVVERVTETSSLVSRPHAYWFRGMATSSHFALNAMGAPSIPAAGFEATFPEATLAVGFLFNCYECRNLPHSIVWTTREADGTEIEHGTIVVEQVRFTGSEQPSPAFVGLTTTKAFRRLHITRAAPFSGGVSPWLIDDLRYATTLPAIEYRHAAFDHYFVTSIADELDRLDDGRFVGWTRTGLQFNVGAPLAAGTRPVCRLFSTAFGPKSSHFYSSDPAECSLRKTDPHWQFEGTVFSLALTDASGTCAPGSVPLFRLYNNGQGDAPNHRYTTSTAARQAMIDAGWISEGAGALGEIGCVLQ